MEESSNSIVESREELMISPTTGSNPISRTAHFLKPSIDSNTDPISSLSSPPSLPPTFDPRNWPLTVNFNGWRNPSKNWKEWVQSMASLHAPTWKQAGIYEAILNSIYRFDKNDELILGFAEKWCPDTNSFRFPWGEATITLEDMFIAGFPVLGSPVYEPIETEESKAIEEMLIRERREICQSKVKKALQCTWLKVFKDSGSDIEHEAFLSMWLSRFVLPTSVDVICKNVFPIAIHLARGTRIALAPAVLATIYRDLRLMKKKIVSLNALDADGVSDERLVVTTFAPFQLVLVWVWERFVKLSPQPNLIKNGEPRFALWHNLKGKFENVRLVLDSSKEDFNWRPYTKPVQNWDMPKFYREEGMWVAPDSCVDEETLSFIRCLRASELVGLELECIEQYLPHRVARQFGFDQTLTGFVARCNASREDAWEAYTRPLAGLKCYIPSRLFQADVTTRYLDLEWWNHSVSVQQQEKNDEITREVSKEEEKKGPGILNNCDMNLKNSKAASEHTALEVSTKRKSKKKGESLTSKSPTSKKAAGKLKKLTDSAKTPVTTKEGEAISTPVRIKEGEAISSVKTAPMTSKEEVKADAECINPRTPSETSQPQQEQTVKRKVSDEDSVDHVKPSKASKTSAQSSSLKNDESDKPAAKLDDINNLSVPPGFIPKNDAVSNLCMKL